MELSKFKYPIEQVGVVDDFYREIFFEKEYDRYGSKVEPGDVVIDFGAFVGMFSHFALTKGAKHVYAVEGEKSHYECLEANTRDFQNITAYHGWVSDRRNDMVNPGLYNVERIMDENNLATVDYLKMDIEGHEFTSLINMSDETMRRVSKWGIEVHLSWSEDRTCWEKTGVDFDGHRASKLLHVMERFTRNGFKLAYEHIHKGYDIVMLYAWK
jgi:hypothetical protein